jgi:hypothetical protein
MYRKELLFAALITNLTDTTVPPGFADPRPILRLTKEALAQTEEYSGAVNSYNFSCFYFIL